MGLFTGEVVNVADASYCGPYKIQNVVHLIVTLAAASAVNEHVFIAPTNYQVVAVREVHGVVGGTGATVNLERLTGTTAPGSGIAILTAALDLHGVAANTVQSTPLSNIITTYGTTGTTLAAGDRLGINLAGTLTGLANCILEITVARI